MHLHEIFCSGFLHGWSNIYKQNNKASECFIFFLEFADLAMTQLMPSLIPRQLSQHQVSLYFDWVNMEWDSTSTESTWNDEIFVNVGAFCIDSCCGVFLRVDSVDVVSHSALTQLTRVSLCVNLVCVRRIKPKQAYITSFKGYRKINHEMFKWGLYQSLKA